MSAINYSIRKNDTVQVIAGKEKGKRGKVLRIDVTHGRIVVERVNMVKRHVKPSQKNPQGGISEKESPIHYSNVLLFCGKCNRGVRHGIKMVESKGKKSSGSAARARICKKCGGVLATTKA